MRYLYVLAVMGEQVAHRMVEQGVPTHEVESWMLYWEQHLADIASAPSGTMADVAAKFVTALKVAAFYGRRVEEGK